MQLIYFSPNLRWWRWKSLLRKRKRNSSKFSSWINRQLRNLPLQDTPNLPNSIAKFNAVEANLMAIKSYFMDDVYELRNEVSSLKSILNNLISNRTETDNQIIIDTLNKWYSGNKNRFSRKGKLAFTIRKTEQTGYDSKSFKK